MRDCGFKQFITNPSLAVNHCVHPIDPLYVSLATGGPIRSDYSCMMALTYSITPQPGTDACEMSGGLMPHPRVFESVAEAIAFAQRESSPNGCIVRTEVVEGTWAIAFASADAMTPSTREQLQDRVEKALAAVRAL